jgi:hypothetical protein
MPHRARLILAALLAALIVGVVGAASARAERQSDETIIRHFDLIAFGDEFSPRPNPRVSKWVRPIRMFVQFDARLEPLAEDFLHKHMARLARLTGVTIDFVASKDDANYVVIFTDRERYLDTLMEHLDRRRATARLMARLGRTHCLGIMSYRKSTAELTRAVVVIPADSARENNMLIACIVEETTQAMGLPNDNDSVVPSVFNDKIQIEQLTPHDLLLLRLLYHPDIEVGMRRKDALEVARRVLPALRAAAGY